MLKMLSTKSKHGTGNVSDNVPHIHDMLLDYLSLDTSKPFAECTG